MSLPALLALRASLSRALSDLDALIAAAIEEADADDAESGDVDPDDGTTEAAPETFGDARRRGL